MASHLRIVNQAAVARWVCAKLAEQAEERKETLTVTPQQVLAVFKCIGNFISFMFRKTQYEWVTAEVFLLGSALRNSSTHHAEFVPSHSLTQETRIYRAFPEKIKEPSQKQELTLPKIANVCQLPEAATHQIM